jgi:hypothetical protein
MMAGSGERAAPPLPFRGLRGELMPTLQGLRHAGDACGDEFCVSGWW